MVKTSAKARFPVLVDRETIQAGPFMAEVGIAANGRVLVRSLAPTRNLRRQHEKTMRGLIHQQENENADPRST